MNRRKYDNLTNRDITRSTSDKLDMHLADDEKRFNKMDRVEKAVWGLYAAIALFGFLLDHPHVITSLTPTQAQAQVVK